MGSDTCLRGSATPGATGFAEPAIRASVILGRAAKARSPNTDITGLRPRLAGIRARMAMLRRRKSDAQTRADSGFVGEG
jgi:hypothetical protein